MDIRNFFPSAGGGTKKPQAPADPKPKEPAPVSHGGKSKKSLDKTSKSKTPPSSKATKTSKKQKKKSVEVENDPEDEADDEQSEKIRPSKKGKRVLLDSDSNVEDPLPKETSQKKRKKKEPVVFLDDSGAAKQQKPAEPKKKTPKKKFAVDIASFFGGGQIHVTDQTVAVAKRKAAETVETEFHDDDDFSKTLQHVDKNEAKRPRKDISPVKEKTNEAAGSSLASKLPPRMKTASPASPAKHDNSNLVPDTPDQQKDGKAKGSASRNWGAYRSFLNREGPLAPGSKEIPEGAENCMEGLTFVITGVPDSLERDEAKSLVERYGGKVTGSVGNCTSYIVVGHDAGASKLEKAEKIDEDGLLDLIRTLPGKKSKYQEQAEHAVKKEQSLKKSTSSSFTALKNSDSKPTQGQSLSKDVGAQLAEAGMSRSSSSVKEEGAGTLMWVDKHKPTSLKQIIGQQGDRSNAKKLLNWIQCWHKNRAADTKPAGRFGQDDGSGFRAALLSGPPGIGKTTTAVLVCKEAGFSTVELNASDKRSKLSLKEDVAEALGNQTLVDYMGHHISPVTGHNHCLIMDEVDGMAGNEDERGLQELVQLVKVTRIPIICICNDRNSLKLRTLANYCFDLRFQRPCLEQIEHALMSIAFKEGLKLSPPALQEIIMASNQDIRQTIHNMSMWTTNNKELSYDQAIQDSKKAQKDVRLDIFDVARKVFAGGEETKGMTINDKTDLFFQEHGFVPLFVHKNYVNVNPYGAKGDDNKRLSLLARTADSICDGDVIHRQIHSSENHSLLPMQAMFASVIPGEYMRGSMSGDVRFPQWLGKNSSTSNNDRVLTELRCHMALQVSCDKRGLNMDYLPALRARLTNPLKRKGSDGIPDVIALMDDYDIIKDDYDNILKITKYPNTKAHLDSKTKAAFTRQYNKKSHLRPYAVKKKQGRAAMTAEDDVGMEEGEGDKGGVAPASDCKGEEDNLETDPMIKVSKKPKGSTTSESKGDSSKGKGPAGKCKSQGKGQGKGKGGR